MIISSDLIGDRYQSATFDSFRVTANNRLAVQACHELIDGKISGVVLLGPCGVGKTHLLIATARKYDRQQRGHFEDGVYVIDQRERIIFYWPVREFASALHGDFSITEDAKKADLVIFDDLGTERNLEYLVTAIEEVLDYRYMHNMPVMIASNLMPSDINKHYGSRMISRWADDYRVIIIDDKDYRVHKHGQAR